MMRLCVYCGSRTGNDPAFLATAKRLGVALAKRRIGVVYGGASIGLMGAVADAALAQGGEVVGVIPQRMVEKEIAHPGLTAMHVVSSMHERKAKMAELSDGFVALPGGFGTLDELFEMVTWAQIGLHAKPIGLLNVNGYYDALLAFADRAVAEGFVPDAHERLIKRARDVDGLLAQLLPGGGI